ncbi:MAG: DUF885 domain-containing protein, partial [Gemmatimonadota bacterium]|nr:DUF885 domain-containing protein [Gemmatimonadota bacterium]
MSATTDLYRSYLDLRWHFDPAAGSAAGLTTYDERLGDFSVERMREHLVAYKAMAAAVEALDVEDQEEEIDRTAFLDEVRVTISRFERERPHIHDPAFWLAHLYRAFHSILRRRHATPADRARALLGRLRATPAFLRSARETVAEPPQVFLDTAVQLVGAGPPLLHEAADAIRAADPEAGVVVDDVMAEALSALARFGLALKGECRAHHDDQSFAIGEEQFNRRLHHEHALGANAPMLYRYGLHLADEVEAELIVLARQIDPSVPWRTVVERLRLHAPPGPDLVDAFQQNVDRARAFVLERNLVAIPDGTLLVRETPSFLRPLMPFAAYIPPAVLSGDATGTFYVTSPAAGHNPGTHSIHEIAATAIHEAWPGHHLQMVTAQSSASLVRQVSWTPVTVEGWALYCEELMLEEGFYATLEERLFQRLHLLWRAIRIVLDIGLHTRGMTPEQAVDMLVDRVAMDRPRAEAEVSRYCAWPTYQLSYAVGRRELLRLRESWRAEVGPDVPIREFHTRVLAYGGLPVSLIRWGMGLGIDE